jgi:hypothetical protein
MSVEDWSEVSSKQTKNRAPAATGGYATSSQPARAVQVAGVETGTGRKASVPQGQMSSIAFKATRLEIAKAHLRDAFLLVQPPLTRAVKAIFVRKFGAAEWITHFKSSLGPSKKGHVYDGRVFDM